MTDDDPMAAVRRAVAGATAQAFAMGQQQSRLHPRTAHEQLARAKTYAEELVLPIVNMAIEEVLEATETARLRRLHGTDAP